MSTADSARSALSQLEQLVEMAEPRCEHQGSYHVGKKLVCLFTSPFDIMLTAWDWWNLADSAIWIDLMIMGCVADLSDTPSSRMSSARFDAVSISSAQLSSDVTSIRANIRNQSGSLCVFSRLNTNFGESL